MLAQRLSKLREKMGLSQNALAKKLGIARTTYAGYENGSREPDVEMINKLSNFHGVTVDYLLGNEKESAYALPESEIEQFIKEREAIYGVLIRDDPVFQAALRALIDSIAQTKLDQQKKSNLEQ